MLQNNQNDSEVIANYKKELLDQTFRNSVSTISKEGNRNFIIPQKPAGKLYNLRSKFSYFYLILFFTLPFIASGRRAFCRPVKVSGNGCWRYQKCEC